MRYGGVSPVSARLRRPFGLLRRAGTRNAASAAHEKTRNHSDRPSWRRLAGTARRAVRRQRWITMTPWTSSTIRSFREAREAGVSCAAKAAFRVRRHGETRRVLAEALRRPTKSRPGARPTAANRRQAIRHAAGFVVARSATPSVRRAGGWLINGGQAAGVPMAWTILRGGEHVL